ncbi:post-transcriptional regulator [Lysinibacillus sp. 2017]|uniref:post-transcriptional regulator n=2 Tax=unclassified Lysinibacillus TaxID=2636778 RepID=UPI001F2A4688|nr:post-transcriptional regulator [Lysinibacillus sp. 2017]
MNMTVPYASLYEKVQIILENKVEEFHYFGYDSITKQDLWGFCVKKVWRKQDVQSLKLHELTSGIFNVSASEIIQYFQVHGLKQASFEMELSKEGLNELFQLLPTDFSKNNGK